MKFLKIVSVPRNRENKDNLRHIHNDKKDKENTTYQGT